MDQRASKIGVAGAVFLATGLAALGAEVGRTVPRVAAGRSGSSGSGAGSAVGLQLALIAPAQIFREEYDVYGLRFNLIYGRNHSMRGLDIGLVNVIGDEFAGTQFGIYDGFKSGEEGVCQMGVDWVMGIMGVRAGLSTV